MANYYANGWPVCPVVPIKLLEPKTIETGAFLAFRDQQGLSGPGQSTSSHTAGARNPKKRTRYSVEKHAGYALDALESGVPANYWKFTPPETVKNA